MISLPQLGKNGRLGNQLFQLAAAYAHCLRTGQALLVPEETDDYRITQRLVLPFGVEKRAEFPAMPNEYAEKRFGFEPISADTRDTVLSGYFQSEKYFADCAPSISNLFAPTQEIVAAVLDKEKKGPLRSVAIGVRRTDYVDNPFHGTIPIDYYREAMKFFPGLEFSVFSDDLEWCKANVPFGNRCSFIDVADPLVKLYLMARYTHFIIANSTYHWWAAWLSIHSSPIPRTQHVIAPKAWFGPDGPKDAEDICPDHWIRI